MVAMKDKSVYGKANGDKDKDSNEKGTGITL